MHKVPLIAVALVLFGASSGVVAQPRPDSFQRCLAMEAQRRGFSGAIRVSEGQRTVADLVRGNLADEASPPISQGTRFNLGSASKMFTAVAIAQLLEQGKLQLDEPVGRIVQGLTPEASRVTIRELLNHTSGLGDFFRPENMQAMLRARTASDILPLIAADKPAFQPGSQFAYSNSGFALLGIVVERVSGLTYGEYLQRYVFGPAGMTSSGLDPKPLSTLAVGMTAGGMRSAGPGNGLVLIGPDGKPMPVSGPPPGAHGLVLIGPDGHPIQPKGLAPSGLRPAPGATEGYGSPAGGLFSTTIDMQRFALALLNGKLIRKEALQEFTSAQSESAPSSGSQPARHYGFGFSLSDAGNLRWFGHGGGTLGANAEFAVQPEHQWIISVLSNRDPPTASNLMRWIKASLVSSRPACD